MPFVKINDAVLAKQAVEDDDDDDDDVFNLD